MATKKPLAKKIPAKKTTVKKPVAKPAIKKTTAKKTPKQKPKSKTPKEIATEKGEPWITIVGIDIDPDNLGQGAFELDWNEIFVARLVKAGYMMKSDDKDSDIVDRWFQNICRNIVLETWEQDQAMNPEYNRVVKSKDIGGGRREVS
jgi:hypothetical protein